MPLSWPSTQDHQLDFRVRSLLLQKVAISVQRGHNFYSLICSNLNEQQPTVSAVSSSFSCPARRASWKLESQYVFIREVSIYWKQLSKTKSSYSKTNLAWFFNKGNIFSEQFAKVRVSSCSQPSHTKPYENLHMKLDIKQVYSLPCQ